MIISLPEGYKGNYSSQFPLHVLLIYSLLHYQTIVQILHHFHFTVTVTSAEVTVNTCTCTDVFAIITTKNQSGGIYNNYSTGGQGIYGNSKQTSSLGYILGLGLFIATNPWDLCYKL